MSTKLSARTAVSTAYAALATAKQTATAVERDSTGIDAAKWSRFDHVVDANISFAAILRDVFAAKLGKPTATGNFIWDQMRTPGSAIDATAAGVNATDLKNLGTAAHFTRCLQLQDRDTAAKRAAYREQGNSPAYKRYLTWFDVMSGKASDDVLKEWDVTRDAKGKATAAKYVKPPKQDEPAPTAAAVPAFLSVALGTDTAARDALIESGLAYLQNIAPEKWESVAAVLVARIAQGAQESAAVNAAGFAPIG
jgi:hypothetical protein